MSKAEELREVKQMLGRIEYLCEKLSIDILLDATPVDQHDADNDWLYTKRTYTARQRTARKALDSVHRGMYQLGAWFTPAVEKALEDIDKKVEVK